MWQESGPERESRTSKCMSGLVWLGEEEDGEGAAAAAAAAAVGGATNEGGKRFMHVFAREWAVPEDILPRNSANTAGAAGAGTGHVAGGGDGSGSGSGSGSSSSNSPAPAARPKGIKPLTDLSLSVGDMVCVSAQGGGTAPGQRRRRGGRGGGRGSGLDLVRLLTGNIAAVYEDRVEVSSNRRMRVPRRGAGRSGRGGGGGGVGGGAGEALDIEDLIGGGEGPLAEERVLFRIDKDEWAAGIK